MNYKIRKNEELADLKYLCKTFVAALHTNKSSFVHAINISIFSPNRPISTILANQTKTICFSSRELEFT